MGSIKGIHYSGLLSSSQQQHDCEKKKAIQTRTFIDHRLDFVELFHPIWTGAFGKCAHVVW